MIDIVLTVTPKTGGNDLLTWAPVPGVGSYRLMRDGKWISSSYDGAKTSWLVKHGDTYLVRAFGGPVAEGVWPRPVTPTLRWPRPVLDNPITINVPPKGPFRPSLLPDRDYIFQMPDVPMEPTSTNGTPCLSLGGGGRNGLLIGGHLHRQNPVPPGKSGDAIGIEITTGWKGTLHLEGLLVDGMWGQAVQLACRSATDKPTVQIQHCRLDASHPTQYPPLPEVHTDSIQSYGGPHRLLLDTVTLTGTGSQLQLQPHNLESTIPIGTWERHHVNCVQTDKTGGNYALFQQYAPAGWPVVQSDCWVHWVAYRAWSNRDVWPGMDGWDPGPTGWSANIQGENWHLGLRPDGDFVPAAAVGIGYKP